MDNKLVAIVLAFLCPPLATAVGGGNLRDVIINVLLTFCLFYIGGIFHALWVISNKCKA